MENITVNEGKELLRIVDGTAYERYALQTKLIGKEDNMVDISGQNAFRDKSEYVSLCIH